MYKNFILILFSLSLLPVSLPAISDVNSFFGDYEGVFTTPGRYPLNRSNSGCVAEVIPLGNNEYFINVMENFTSRAEKIATAQGRLENGKVVFENEIIQAVIANDSLQGQLLFRDRWLEFKLARIERLSPTMGAVPTDNAIVLFDGSGFDEWIGAGGQPVKWDIVNGNEAEVVPSGPNIRPKHDINTKREFSGLFLHLEFKLSLMAESRGQQRANSGVIFEGLGEIQILDSYGLEGTWSECGAIYRNSPPKVNMCLPPLTWQTFDIIFHTPGYDENGQRIKHGEITVFHNGKRIHYKYPLKGGPDQLDAGQTGFPVSFRLQDHQDVLWFRNIWAVDLNEHPDALPDFIRNIEL